MVNKNCNQMKKVILAPIFFVLINCTKLQNCYTGYVYDETSKKPLNKVFIKENFKKNSKSTFTNEKGYFKIDNKSESVGNLIFILNGYKTDTIITIWSQHGEILKYRFVGKESDTLFMRKVN